MKLTFKIVLVNAGISLLLAVLCSIGNSYFSAQDLLGWFGLASLGIAVLDLITGIIMLIAGQQYHEWAKGFLLSGGILLLAGLLTCGSVLNNINMH